MQRKKLFTICTALLLTWPCITKAQDATQRLVLWQKNGEKIFFELSEQPVTTFEDGKLVITTNNTTTYYLIENVVRYTYEGAMTAIHTPILRPGEIIFRQNNDKMVFDGLTDGTTINVYSIDGKVLFSQKAHKGETTVISFANHPTGTYLVKVNDATYKFIKR